MASHPVLAKSYAMTTRFSSLAFPAAVPTPSYNEIGGLGEQIRELREVIELPLLNPELFMRVGITPPKVG